MNYVSCWPIYFRKRKENLSWPRSRFSVSFSDVWRFSVWGDTLFNQLTCDFQLLILILKKNSFYFERAFISWDFDMHLWRQNHWGWERNIIKMDHMMTHVVTNPTSGERKKRPICLSPLFSRQGTCLLFWFHFDLLLSSNGVYIRWCS